MKRIYILGLLCFVSFVVISCGTHKDFSENSEVALPTMEDYATKNPEPKTSTLDSTSKVVPTASSEVSIEKDLFVGEYNDVDCDEPSLEIKKLEDGTYKIEIRIFRLYYITDCIGKFIDDKIEFSSDEVEGKTLKGTITLNDQGDATVRFVSGFWQYLNSEDEYVFYKTSDKPYDKGQEH